MMSGARHDKRESESWAPPATMSKGEWTSFAERKLEASANDRGSTYLLYLDNSLQTILSNEPSIFIHGSDSEKGDMDFYLCASSTSKLRIRNATMAGVGH